MRVHHVPLAVDAQIRVPLGPALIPLRALCALVAAALPALLLLGVGAIPLPYRLGLALSLFLVAFGISAPDREGVWIATWWLYRLGHRFMPSAILNGEPVRARVETVAGSLCITDSRQPLGGVFKLFGLASVLLVPSAATTLPGVVRLTPGGSRALLMLEGPLASIGTDKYAHWCERVLEWLLAIECPAQMLTVLDHFDSQRAQAAFDQRVQGWPRTPLADLERDLAGRVADQSVRFRHCIILAPGMAGADGLPAASRVTRLTRADEATDEEAARALEAALRTAAGMDLAVAVPDRDDIGEILSHTLLGATSAAAGRNGQLQLGEEAAAVVTVVRLPSAVHQGVVVDALLRARVRGVASLHVFPVAPSVARRLLDRRASIHRYAAREGNDAIDNQVALAETSAVLASIAQRDLRPCRVALTFAISDPHRDRLSAAVERLDGLLASRGFGVVPVTSPAFLGAMAASPGCAPLGRSLQMTSEDVVACMLPALGTPYSDYRQSLLGFSLATSSPVYLSIWSRPNYNALVLGSSGAGKSVAAKTLLIRHLMEGATAVVIDPDSEYRRVMNAVGGHHFELGDDAINVLAACSRASPDVDAGMVLPVLSVMAGDEKGIRDGRPIRRLADEDQGWLHGEIADFFRTWREGKPAQEPLISDLVRFLEQTSSARLLTRREEERCRIVVARLRRFTQGYRAEVFDRPSTFELNDRPTSIGLRSLAMSYAADLTPALAIVLTAILSSLSRRTRRTIIVVDEAHRITTDPDAGDVLGQLVRQARKHAAGVWMCSQRVEDFISTDLGKTLAATASTKLLLGAEESSVAAVRDVFSLDEDESAAINPLKQGRGVLISGGERAVISVVPGAAILALADTTPPSLRPQAVGTASA